MARNQVLKELRQIMKVKEFVGPEPIHAYIIPSGDAHQSEYLAACDKRRAFVSGFTGSAGTAIVTEDHACMWTDGRYFLQATKEMSQDWTLMKEGIPSTPSQGTWLSKTLARNSRVGFDPYLMSQCEFRPLKTLLESSGIDLVAVDKNLVDIVWDKEKPQRPRGPAMPLELKYTGVTSASKVCDLREQMLEKNAVLFVLTALDEIAWLLNLRGSDISYNPVFFSYASVSQKGVTLFIDESKVTAAVHEHFEAEGLQVGVATYDSIRSHIEATLNELGPLDKIWISENSSVALTSLVPDQSLLTEVSPVAIAKTIKNPTEVNGMINAHIKDAAALCRYFAWLEKEVALGNAVTEISGATKLEQFRSELPDFVGLSFETISSVGPNAAIIHYSPDPSTDRPITDKHVYLCDSGAQFKDGTTDVTRTIHLGTPTDFEREAFTRVFKGAYAIRSCIFPSKIKGNYLDTLARKPLWDIGLDYLHGTSHGIGSYLNVHEGPIGITFKNRPNDPGMQANMFLSNEPGYYEDGSFGIRIENIVRTVPAKVRFNFKDRGFLTFEDVTVVPLQTKMFLKSLLTPEEVSYVNEYHAKCLELVGPLLKGDALQWLQRETQPI
ncbi:xaa-Pro aminopeptidase 1 [Neocloeon triangulifer]|uniref:xaa-Pro aminopeptidase 1 n=1 Tax=Neocloeon triangulifer TaxID=2078957 RepID=UPI00286F24F2|nr:xaa-Pro aminopeptidase 1 [Neocloeon triangulifer]